MILKFQKQFYTMILLYHFQKSAIERHAKLSDGPCEIRLLSYPIPFLEIYFVAFKVYGMIIMIGWKIVE